jgi:HlyD family secretion protein
VAEVVGELERELRAQSRRRWLKRLYWVGAALLLLALVVFARRWFEPVARPRFTTQALEKRDVVEVVQSTGTVKPLTEVQVGAQVSGRVVRVLVDFNSNVKKGDLLAEIDPSLFGAQVSQVGAQLESARAALRRTEAQRATARASLERAKRLASEGLASEAELDQAQGAFDVAQAEVLATTAQITQLQAQLSSARTTLAYTRIHSPIDGVVVNRSVEPGQTVAASFSAPVLFVIAQDLSKMQVLAEIDEADVGKLAEGMGASVVVDAFPGKKFEGRVTQLRYSPNNVQGVVTYSAVIAVENPRLELRPGMTATVTVRTREARGALAVPNAALRFRPRAAAETETTEASAQERKAEPPLVPGQGRVFVVGAGELGNESAVSHVVSVGITDGVFTELRSVPRDSGLVPGAAVVIEQREEKDRKRRGPFGM